MSKEKSNIEEMFKNLIMNKQFFFNQPDDKKYVIYSFIYVVLTALGSYLDVWFVTSFFSVFLLSFIVGYKGLKYTSLLAGVGILLSYVLSGYNSVFWHALHFLVAIVVYFALVNRYPKILLILYISALIFFGVSLYSSLLIKAGLISFDPKQIENFISSYVDNVVSLQPNVDKNLLYQSFDDIKIHFSTLLFIGFVFYALILVQYTLMTLAREKVIIPIFPKFSLVAIRGMIVNVYIILILISLFVTVSADYNIFTIENLMLENIISIIRWALVFNGLFTCYYFVEVSRGKLSIFTQITLFVLMYLFNPIFELIGFVDASFKVRERYAAMKGES